MLQEDLPVWLRGRRAVHVCEGPGGLGAVRGGTQEMVPTRRVLHTLPPLHNCNHLLEAVRPSPKTS